jgi:hypothetical protein
MDWKTEFEQMKERLECLGCACMEHEEALEIKEALKDEAFQSTMTNFLV